MFYGSPCYSAQLYDELLDVKKQDRHSSPNPSFGKNFRSGEVYFRAFMRIAMGQIRSTDLKQRMTSFLNGYRVVDV